MKRFRCLCSFFLVVFAFSAVESAFARTKHFAAELFENRMTVVTGKPKDGGIRESIPRKFEQRYRKWKDELLASEFGREQWERYASNKNFVLKIVVSNDNERGAATGDYEWTEAGELVGATILLGDDLDKGFPNPIYFPVMNSLEFGEESTAKINRSVLAAAKIAHEFGHVNLTAATDPNLIRLQNKLISDYNKILLSNGHNPNDARLLDLAGQMGGSPVEIWENREYWGEANAMRYLVDRINGEDFYCSILSKIRHNVSFYAKNYEARFTEIADSKKPSVCAENHGD